MPVDARSAAYHEAGHAVMAWHLRRSFGRVTIAVSEEIGGTVTHDREPSWWYDDHLPSNANVERFMRDRIMIGWAGRLAQERLGIDDEATLDEGFAYDLRTIALHAAEMTGSRDEAEAYLEWLRLRTRNALYQPIVWPCVEAVADALVERGTLSARTVRAICTGTRERLFAEHYARVRKTS